MKKQPPTPHERIWLSPPHLSGNEKELVNEALDSNWVAPVGPHLTQFENEIKQHTGSQWAVALNSGTSALVLGLRLLNLKPNDGVIVPTFNFMASVLPVLYARATPILAGTHPHHWNTGPQQLEQAIGMAKQQGITPKVFINVHLFGNPAPMHELLPVCQQHRIAILDDAAEALGSTLAGQACGNLGSQLGVLSFNGNKIITASGGGMLLGNDPALEQQARYLANMAKQPGVPHYQFNEIGYSMGMSNILAALGLAQLQHLSSRIAERSRVFGTYQEQLQPLGFKFQASLPQAAPNHWLTCATLPHHPMGTNQKIIETLGQNNIEARPLWRPLHRQPVLQGYPCAEGHTADQLEATGLCLPSGSSLSPSQQQRVIDTIKQAMAN